MTSAESLHPLCERLAGICDGALKRDDAGFNRMDSIFGKSLAARPPSRWTPKQAWAAWHLLQKYHRQVPEIAQVPRPQDPKTIAPLAGGGASTGSVELSGDLYLLKFPYGIEAVSRVKALPRRRWDKERRAWTVPAGHVEWSTAMLSLAIEESWALGAGVREAVEADLTGATRRLADSKAREASGWVPKRWRAPEGLSLLPYQAAGVAYLVERERSFLADEMGCIAGSAIVTVQRAGASRRMTLQKLFSRLIGQTGRWDRSIPCYLKSLVDGQLVLKRLLGAIDRGISEVVQVKTEGGREIVCTPDHEFAASDGSWVKAEDLLGRMILVNGKRKIAKKGEGRFLDKDGYVMVFRPNHPRARKSGHVQEHVLVAEAITGQPLVYPLQVHHIDGNRANNSPDNIRVVTPSEHHRLHSKHLHMDGALTGRGGRIWFIPKSEKVISVRRCGEERVFDLQMEGPGHNFVADGFIVHNCGKTIQALVALEELDAFPALVICPASLKTNWDRESEKWLPDRSRTIFSGRPRSDDQIAPAEISIFNYDILAAWESILSGVKWRALILDECHRCKGGKTQRTSAAYRLAQNIPYRFALSGTPILNRPAELISQLKILGRLEDIGGWMTFAERYCGRYWNGFTWDMSGAKNLDELNTKLRIHGYVRRLKVDVLTELPEKRRVTVPLEGLDLGEYRGAEENLSKWLRENDRRCGQGEELGPDAADAAKRAEALTRIEALKQLAWRAKQAACLEWIREFLENSDQKLLVFAWHKSAVQDTALLLDAPYITGDVPPDVRQRCIDKFQHDPGTRVICGNIQAMGVGLTLTAASNVCFLELPWTPAECDQAEDRCHRIGQKSSVTAWYLLAPGTIDGDIADLLEEKRRVVDGATEASAAARSIFSGLIGRIQAKGKA